MLKYLVVLLDDTSTSFCHYPVLKAGSALISLEHLRNGVLFAMKENLNVQFVYPDHGIPAEYEAIVESVDHVKIVSSRCTVLSLLKRAGIVVFNDWSDIAGYGWDAEKAYVIRTSKNDLFERYESLVPALGKAGRLNVVVTDVETFTEEYYEKYKSVLAAFSEGIRAICRNERFPQLNLLTDRMMLKGMNNCNAGDEVMTLAPDGRFYVCPAFYHEQIYDIGSIETGLNVKNPPLYKIQYAPICRRCDAYQCKRCVWLNQKTTLEVNTPSHEQCVMSHLERDESRRLLDDIRKLGEFMPEISISGTDYLDPFEKHNEW